MFTSYIKPSLHKGPTLWGFSIQRGLGQQCLHSECNLVQSGVHCCIQLYSGIDSKSTKLCALWPTAAVEQQDQKVGVKLIMSTSKGDPKDIFHQLLVLVVQYYVWRMGCGQQVKGYNVNLFSNNKNTEPPEAKTFELILSICCVKWRNKKVIHFIPLWSNYPVLLANKQLPWSYLPWSPCSWLCIWLMQFKGSAL